MVIFPPTSVSVECFGEESYLNFHQFTHQNLYIITNMNNIFQQVNTSGRGVMEDLKSLKFIFNIYLITFIIFIIIFVITIYHIIF